MIALVYCSVQVCPYIHAYTQKHWYTRRAIHERHTHKRKNGWCSTVIRARTHVHSHAHTNERARARTGADRRIVVACGSCFMRVEVHIHIRTVNVVYIYSYEAPFRVGRTVNDAIDCAHRDRIPQCSSRRAALCMSAHQDRASRAHNICALRAEQESCNHQLRINGWMDGSVSTVTQHAQAQDPVSEGRITC